MRETFEATIDHTPQTGVLPERKRQDSAKNLAEAIILQSMEDFWNNTYRQESIDFFKGEGFGICAGLAGMGREEQMKLLEMLASSSKKK